MFSVPSMFSAVAYVIHKCIVFPFLYLKINGKNKVWLTQYLCLTLSFNRVLLAYSCNQTRELKNRKFSSVFLVRTVNGNLKLLVSLRNILSDCL